MTAHGHGDGHSHRHGSHAGHPSPPHAPGGGEGAVPFTALLGEVMATAERFGHRQHVHLTWLAVRRHGTAAAIGLVGDGIRRTARYEGAPQKYNATVSRAWVELVGHHAGHTDSADTVDPAGAADFDAFAERNPALLDKRLLTRFYRPSTLASTEARSGWVEPDAAPFPWKRPADGE